MGYILFLGAGSDIARALEREYARAGFGIYLAGRNPEEMRAIAEDLKIRFGVDARPFSFDVTDFPSHRAFYQALDPKPLGAVCAAGYLGDPRTALEEFEETRRIIETNYLGCVSILNIIGADFERRREGFIIGISSVAGDRGRAGNSVYGSAKAGFSAYLSGLRCRLDAAGVQVLTAKPGFVRSKMTDHLELPGRLTSEAGDAARDIFDAQRKGRDIVYTKWIWRIVMAAIVHIPEKLFKKLKL